MPDAVVETADRSDLADKIQSSFDAVFGEVNESDLKDDAPEPEGDRPEIPVTTMTEAGSSEVEEKPATETTEPEAATETEATPKDESEAAVSEAKPGAPTLPDAYRRSLKAYEWTDEEIDANLKSMGPAFIATAAKLHQTRNKEVAEWAKIGRQARDPAPTQTQTTDTRTASQPQQPATLQRVDVEKLKKQYGEEALIDEIVGPMNRVVDQINQILPTIQQTQYRSKQAELETLGRQVDGFFGGKDMTTYKDQYGASSAGLNDSQLEARQKVLEMADALIVGAGQQGRMLTFGEAMQLAHDSVSSGTQKKAARQEIAGKLQQRNKGISLKPSGKSAVKTSPASNRSDLEKRIGQGLRTMFQ